MELTRANMRRKTTAEKGRKYESTTQIFLIAMATMLLATQARAVLTWASHTTNLGRWIQRDRLVNMAG